MGTLHVDQYMFYFLISNSIFLRMRDVSDRICRENQNTNFKFSNFFLKSCPLRDTMEKYCRVWQATNHKMVHVHCMLHT
jgi:hypothetical protein